MLNKLNQQTLTLFNNNGVNYRQHNKTKFELYTKSPYYDKVFFFAKSRKLKCLSWGTEKVVKVETEIELLETIRRLERGVEL